MTFSLTRKFLFLKIDSNGCVLEPANCQTVCKNIKSHKIMYAKGKHRMSAT